jgi:hypothetical protein
MFAKGEREINRKISAKRKFTIIPPQANYHSTKTCGSGGFPKENGGVSRQDRVDFCRRQMGAARLAFFINICYNNYVTLHNFLLPSLCTLTKIKKLCYVV